MKSGNQSEPDKESAGLWRAATALSARAKSSGHGKKTADKWNQ